MAYRIVINLAVRNPQTKRLMKAKAEAVVKDMSLDVMRELYYAERAVNDNTPIRMTVDVIDCPEDITLTPEVEE